MQLDSLNWHGMGRRHFMRRLAALGSTVLVGGAAVPLVGCGKENGTGARLLVLSAAQAVTLAACADAIVPHQAGFPSVAEAQIVTRLDEELWFSDSSIQDDLCTALALFEWLPLGYGYFGRFSTLSMDARQRLLQQMMGSGIETVRAIAGNFRLLIMLFYFGHRSSWAAIGYDGTFQKLPPRLSEQRQRYAAAVAASKAADLTGVKQ